MSVPDNVYLNQLNSESGVIDQVQVNEAVFQEVIVWFVPEVIWTDQVVVDGDSTTAKFVSQVAIDTSLVSIKLTPNI